MASTGRGAYEIIGLRAQRGVGATAFHLLVPSMVIHQGSKVALIGPSGCGKSTLLELLSLTGRARGAERFQIGTAAGVFDARAPLIGGHASALARVRGSTIGCVPQSGALLGFASVGRNIMVGRKLRGMVWDATLDRLLARLGIAAHVRKYPSELSAGERQRVAIARALAPRPRILVIDEPTAALDPDNADVVMALVSEIVAELGITAIMATHDRERAERFGFSPIPFTVGVDPQTGHRSSMCEH